MKKLNKKAFTIVELVIVIAVVAILAAVLIPTFLGVVRKSRLSNDYSLVRTLNDALTQDAAYIGRKHLNPTEALQVADEYGYSIGKINAKTTGNQILWDSVNDVFCYLNEDEVEYLPEVDGTKLSAGDYRLWKIYTQAPADEDGYSIYVASQAAADYVAGKAALTVGVDCGTGEYEVSNVNYVRDGAGDDGRSVVIRTSSLETEVTVNAPKDEVAHYGKAKSVNVIAVKPASYEENGTVPFLEVSQGRVVLGTESKVETLYINKIAETNTFADITIKVATGATMPEVKRDSVGTALGEALVKVCTIETDGKTEAVFLKTSGAIADEAVYVSTTGNAAQAVAVTESTASDVVKQLANNKVGDEVVDNGSTAEEKQEVKQEVVDVVQAVEIAAEIDNGATYAVRVGAKGYETIGAAYAAAEGKTMVLLKNISMTGYLNVMYTTTLDLNGYTIARADNANWVIANSGTGTLTINDSSEGHTGGIVSAGNGTYNVTVINRSTGNVVINGGTYSAKYWTVDNISTGTLTINGGTFNSTEVSVGSEGAGNIVIRNADIVATNGWALNITAGTVTMHSGTITSPFTPVWTAAGTNVVINNATISSTATNDDWHYAIYCNGSMTINNAIVTNHIKGVTVYNGGTGSIVINDGSYSVTDAVQGQGVLVTNSQAGGSVTINGGAFRKSGVNTKGILSQQNGTISVRGGTFNGAFSFALIADGYKYDYADGIYTISAASAEGEYGASIGDTNYATFAAALAAAQDGDTIKVLKDDYKVFNGNAGVDVTKNITIDLNGKKLINGKDYVYGLNVLNIGDGTQANAVSVTIKDTVGGGLIFDATGGTNNAGYAVLVKQYSNLTIEGGTFYNNQPHGNYPVNVYLNGTCTIVAGTFNKDMTDRPRVSLATGSTGAMVEDLYVVTAD